MCRKVAFFFAVLIVCGAATSQADDFLLAQLYGSGVHAYNGGDYNTAYRELTAAIQGGTIDPRAYYFRGLTYLRMGRQQEAAADFQKGAEMETGDSNDVFPVSNSLARVQGPDRDMLERYREAARVTAHQRQEAARQARYEQRVEAEKTVLRKVQPTELTLPETTAELPAAGAANDPFAEPKPVPSPQQPAATPKTDETPKSDDPFGAAPAKAPDTNKPAPTDANPFGEPATKSKPAPAAAEAAVPAAAQRFTKVANKLIEAINRSDSAAIQASLDTQMQQALPPDKATPFFQGLVTAGGKLKNAAAPKVDGSTAIVRVTAERGAWDFKITLDASDKISGLYVTPPGSGPAEKPAADSKPKPTQPAADENPFK